MLSHIIEMVNSASRSKSPIQNLADKISGYFVPVVVGISIICESKVSEPTFSAIITNVLFPLMVPELTLSLTFLSTGMGSPEIID